MPAERGADGEREAAAVEAEREPNFLLARWERPTLIWIARRLPRWVLPDDMTVLGLVAAFGICVAYQVTNQAEGLAVGGERAPGRAVASTWT